MAGGRRSPSGHVAVGKVSSAGGAVGSVRTSATATATAGLGSGSGTGAVVGLATGTGTRATGAGTAAGGADLSSRCTPT